MKSWTKLFKTCNGQAIMVYLTSTGQANLSLYLNLDTNQKHMRNVTGTWENWDVEWHQVQKVPTPCCSLCSSRRNYLYLDRLKNVLESYCLHVHVAHQLEVVKGYPTMTFNRKSYLRAMSLDPSRPFTLKLLQLLSYLVSSIFQVEFLAKNGIGQFLVPFDLIVKLHIWQLLEFVLQRICNENKFSRIFIGFHILVTQGTGHATYHVLKALEVTDLPRENGNSSRKRLRDSCRIGS